MSLFEAIAVVNKYKLQPPPHPTVGCSEPPNHPILNESLKVTIICKAFRIKQVSHKEATAAEGEAQCNVQQTKTDGDAVLMSIDMFFICLSEYQ